MHSRVFASVALIVGCVLTPMAVFAQSSTTAAIAGVVRDATGAVLPGATVEAASPVLIEKVRAAVTDAQGNYKIIDLRPGAYSVTISLPGFGTYKREGVELTTGITATVNADLKVGSLAETVTVTGASPTVDIQNVRTQTVLTREVLDALPTAKTLQSYAALTLGATFSQANNQDVGGNQGEAGGAGSFGVHGSRGSDQRMTLDGMPFQTMVGGGAAGNRTSMLNQMAVAETAIQTGGIGADSETGGVQINIVPKDGGNTFSGSGIANGTSGRFQSSNLDAALIARGVATPPKVKEIYDLGVGFGGPVVRDRLWFYTSHRRWGTQNTVPGLYFNKTPHLGLYTPDLSRPAYTWIHNRDHGGRLTWQATSRQKVAFSESFQWPVNEYYEVERGRAPEASGRLTWVPNVITQGTWNYPRTNRLLFEAGALSLYEIQKNYPVLGGDVAPGDVSIAEIGGSLPNMYNSRATSVGSGGGGVDYGRNSESMASQRAAVSYVTGTHAFKAGLFLAENWETGGADLLNIPGLGPVSYRYLNGAPFQVVQWRSPKRVPNRVRPIMGIHAQDQWTLQRLTLNLGIRYDHIYSYAPEVTLPAIPEFGIPATSFPKVDNVPNWHDLSPRVGAAYDAFGNGKTAIKGSIGKYNIANTSGIASANAPGNRIANNTFRSWNDSNGNRIPNCNLANSAANGECGPWLTPNFGQATASTTYDPALLTGWAKRDYNWQAAATLQHELRSSLTLNAGYFRTWYGKFRVTTNRALTPADFDPYCITAPSDARLGAYSGKQICGLYDPKRVVSADSFITFASNFGTQTEVFNGLDVSLQTRFGKGRMLQGGVSTGHVVTDNCAVVKNNPQIPLSIATYSLQPSGTGSRSSSDFCRLVQPWSSLLQFKIAGNYPLLYGINVSGTFQSLPGIPIYAVQTVTGAQTTLGRNLTAGSATIALNVPYSSFEDRMTQMDVRFSKTVKLGRYRVQGQFDVYNAFNANTVLQENPLYGATWQKPLAVLGARMLKFGTQIDF